MATRFEKGKPSVLSVTSKHKVLLEFKQMQDSMLKIK